MLSLLYVLISGIALPIGGIQMQYLWRNQLGDVYSLGLGSAACLGAAAATMSGWCSLTIGSFVCTLICTFVCFFVTLRVSTQNLITFGILFGTFIGSLGTIVVTNAPDGDLLKQYYLWGAANFNMVGVTTWDIVFSLALPFFNRTCGRHSCSSCPDAPFQGRDRTDCSAQGPASAFHHVSCDQFCVNLRPYRFHIPGCSESEPYSVQKYGYPETLSYLRSNGSRTPSCNISCGEVCEFRHIPSCKRNNGHHCASADGHSVYKEVSLSALHESEAFEDP